MNRTKPSTVKRNIHFELVNIGNYPIHTYAENHLPDLTERLTSFYLFRVGGGYGAMDANVLFIR